LYPGAGQIIDDLEFRRVLVVGVRILPSSSGRNPDDKLPSPMIQAKAVADRAEATERQTAVLRCTGFPRDQPKRA
jgi:hypothetical protein